MKAEMLYTHKELKSQISLIPEVTQSMTLYKSS